MKKIFDENEEWDGFWANLVTYPDGTINLEQLKKELCDYSMLLENVPTVYSNLTHGAISYPNTESWEVISVAEDANNKYYHNLYRDDILEILNDDSQSSEDKLEEIKQYFGEERE